MRALQRYFSVFIIFGLSFFVTVNKAYADVNVLEGHLAIRHVYANSSASQQFGGSDHWRQVVYGSHHVIGWLHSTNQVAYTDQSVIEAISTNLPYQNLFSTSLTSQVTSGMEMDICYNNSAQPIFKRGERCKLVFSTNPMCLLNIVNTESNQQYPNYVTKVAGYYGTNLRVIVRDAAASTNHELTLDDDGCYTVPCDTNWVVFRFTVNRRDATVTTGEFCIQEPRLYLLDNERVINRQTQQLMNTDGSDTTVSNVQNQYVSAVTGKLGFLQQTGETVNGIYQAVMNTDESNSIRFPGVTFQEYTIIPAQDVPLLGYFPEVENKIRTMITLLLFLAWLHGLRTIYDKIFLGEVEVITDDE